MHSLAILLHILAAVIWVGGMFFAYMVLRPVAAKQFDPPQRLPLWVNTFSLFFPWVWMSVILLPVTGYWMIFGLYGSMANTPVYVHIMNGLGIIMILIYMHVFFAPFRRLKQAVAIEDWPTGGKKLAQIRVLVGINLLIGLIVISVASAGRFL
jgi:uncharacterized membrane protein